VNRHQKHMRDSQWTVLIITICSSLYKKEI
jgi:hypothetical protein